MIFLEAVAAVGKSITSAVLGGAAPDKSTIRKVSSEDEENYPDNGQGREPRAPRGEVETVS
jgi:hypothetical protein